MSDLLKDLAVVVNGNAFDHCFDRINCVKFMRTHHATIQQNAEDAKRLMALERAWLVLIGEWGDGACSLSTARAWVTELADEILRDVDASALCLDGKRVRLVVEDKA